MNATDAELNTWKSLKQVTKQMTPDELENEHNYWSRLNPHKLEERKKRVFRSIYGTEEEKGDYLNIIKLYSQRPMEIDSRFSERIAESTEKKKGQKMNSKRRRRLRAREALLKLEETQGEKIENGTQEVKNEQELENEGEDQREAEEVEAEVETANDGSTKKSKKRRRKKKDGKVQKMTDERLAAYNLDPKEFRKSHKYNDLSLKYKAE